MNKIWIVESEWKYNGCADDFINCYEHSVEAAFESEDEAIRYILEKLKNEIKSSLNDDHDNLTFVELPEEEIIKRDKRFTFDHGYREESGYHYYDMKVL